MKTFFLIIGIILPQTLIFAGVRGVGNGGGFGEMIAVSTFEKMERYLTPCLSDLNPCKLTNGEQILIEKVTNSMSSERNSYQLGFFDSENINQTVLTDSRVGSPIKINSMLLADDKGIPYSLNIIGSWVLYALLRHQNVDDHGIAKKVFEKLVETRRSLAIKDYSLHWLKIIESDQRSTLDELILEENEKSINLSYLFNNTQLCLNKNDLNLSILDWEQDSPFSSVVILDVNWDCGDKKFGKAKIQLDLIFDSNNHFDQGKSRASAFGIIKPKL